jgi:hypothetical protein
MSIFNHLKIKALHPDLRNSVESQLKCIMMKLCLALVLQGDFFAAWIGENRYWPEFMACESSFRP